VKLLLDTNALIWWLQDDTRLGPKARSLISDPVARLFVSVVSLWEITIKWRVGKMDFAGSSFLDELSGEDIATLPILPQHLRALEDLPMHHRDPFDHLILAQAGAENARLLTSDREMTSYGVPCIPALR
jgi:PIN domain nuclease of toxin-antitoxin system